MRTLVSPCGGPGSPLQEPGHGGGQGTRTWRRLGSNTVGRRPWRKKAGAHSCGGQARPAGGEKQKERLGACPRGSLPGTRPPILILRPPPSTMPPSGALCCHSPEFPPLWGSLLLPGVTRSSVPSPLSTLQCTQAPLIVTVRLCLPTLCSLSWSHPALPSSPRYPLPVPLPRLQMVPRWPLGSSVCAYSSLTSRKGLRPSPTPASLPGHPRPHALALSSAPAPWKFLSPK